MDGEARFRDDVTRRFAIYREVWSMCRYLQQSSNGQGHRANDTEARYLDGRSSALELGWVAGASWGWAADGVDWSRGGQADVGAGWVDRGGVGDGGWRGHDTGDGADLADLDGAGVRLSGGAEGRGLLASSSWVLRKGKKWEEECEKEVDDLHFCD